MRRTVLHEGEAEKMDIHKLIESQTRNNEDQKSGSKPKFQKVKQDLKITKSPRARGEKPQEFGEFVVDKSNTESSNCKKKSKQIQMNTSKQALEQQSSSNDTDDDEFKFAGILSQVREVGGGKHTQSNEVIERRYREKQKKHAENKVAGCDQSPDVTYTSQSSETTDSYKTAQQDSFHARSVKQQQKTSMIIKDNSLERYKKNALIKGLLQDAVNKYSDEAEFSTDNCSSDYTTASLIDIQCSMQNLNIDPNEQTMYEDRIGRLFQPVLVQSQEDEDVYEHPLRHQIKKDPVWQKTSLKRKGMESIETPRRYFMNLDDSGFDFQTP